MYKFKIGLPVLKISSSIRDLKKKKKKEKRKTKENERWTEKKKRKEAASK